MLVRQEVSMLHNNALDRACNGRKRKRANLSGSPKERLHMLDSAPENANCLRRARVAPLRSAPRQRPGGLA